MSAHEQYIDDIALLALGTLSEAEAAPIRAHMAQCEQCAQEYTSLREVADVLPLAGADPQGAPPRAALKRRVMAITQTATTESQSRSRLTLLPYALAAAFLIAAIILGSLYSVVNRRISDDNVTISDLASPASQRFHVPGGEVVRSGGHIYIVMRSAPVPPSGKVYQAWTLPSGSKRVAPSVTFVPRNGRTLLRLPVDAHRVSAVAVSVEPTGGSLQPTSKPVFLVIFPASKG